MKKYINFTIISVLMIMSFILTGCGKSDKDNDPNLGLYAAKYGSMMGIEMEVGDVFGEGFTIELKSKGKCEIFVDGDKANGKWTLDGDEITIKGGGIECSGTLSQGVMILEDVMGSGLELTLINDSYSGTDDGDIKNKFADRLNSMGGDSEQNQESGVDSGMNSDIPDSVDEGPTDRRTEIQKYWNGDWYGWFNIYDATGNYKGYKGNSYDAFGRVEIDENGDGFLTLWYGYENGNTYNDPTGRIKINVSYEAGFGSHGTAISTGGWMFANDQNGWIEEMDFVIDPDEADYSDSMYFYNTYEDNTGSLTYIWALRPWGHRWEDVQANDNITLEASLHAFNEWYIPLIDEGWAMPDGYGLKPTRTMEEYEEEMIAAAANQPIPEGYSGSSSDSETSDSAGESSSSGGSDTNISNAKVTGKSYTWGNITVNVPDGMTSTNGGIADRNDENSLWLQNGSSYILVSLCDKDKAQSDVAGTKSANGGKDTSVTVNGVKWTGTYYEYSGSPCWHIYGEVNGNYFTAMGYNYSLDSVELQTVLATLKHS